MSRRLARNVHEQQATEQVLMGNFREWPASGHHKTELRCKEKRPI